MLVPVHPVYNPQKHVLSQKQHLLKKMESKELSLVLNFYYRKFQTYKTGGNSIFTFLPLCTHHPDSTIVNSWPKLFQSASSGASPRAEDFALTFYCLMRGVLQETKGQGESFSPGDDFHNIKVEDVRKQNL